MSSLIKRGQQAPFRIQPLEVEEIRPARKGPEGEPMAGDTREEDVPSRLARLEREAYEKGYEQGQKDGLTLGEKRVQERIKQLEALIHGLAALKAEIYLEAERDLVKLSTAIARKIIKKELETDPRVVARSVRSALEALANRSSVRIRVNPDDLSEVKPLLPVLQRTDKLEKCTLVEDDGIEKGGCMLETDFGRVNATLTEALAALEKKLEKELQARMEGKPDVVS